MAKICTDIEQSKKLLELGLSQETADMSYIETPANEFRLMAYNYKETMVLRDLRGSDAVVYPCWSLSALLELIPYPSLHRTVRGWSCESYNREGNRFQIGMNTDNPLDAAFEMVCRLLENEKI